MPIDPIFRRIKLQARGMLDPEVYAEISRAAARAKGDILEVGTAHGAATVALALGAPEGTRIHTIDKLTGGSRSHFGGIEENLAAVQSVLKSFGVEERVEVHVGTSDAVHGQTGSGRLGLLLLDADGCIDREMGLFYNRLAPGSPIVIDDFRPDHIPSSRKTDGLFVDQKFRLTSMLVEYYLARGLLQRERIVGHTFFGIKPATVTGPVAFDPGEVLVFYRRLVFARAARPKLVRDLAGRVLRESSPRLHLWLKTHLKAPEATRF